MPICLFTSPISTFARKVAIGLELKGLPYEAVDALRRDFRPRLVELNPRAEVPVLTDGELTVVNSSDILQYLDWRYPEAPPLHPAAIEDKVAARALERLADQRLDPVVVDSSYWHWADRDDQPPPGLLDAARHDVDRLLGQLEAFLAPRPRPWPFGAPGVVECAWFPNLSALKPFGMPIDAARFPAAAGWLDTMRRHPVFRADLRRTADYLAAADDGSHEKRTLFWSGERLEWLFARGFHDWFYGEIAAGRVAFPP